VYSRYWQLTSLLTYLLTYLGWWWRAAGWRWASGVEKTTAEDWFVKAESWRSRRDVEDDETRPDADDVCFCLWYVSDILVLIYQQQQWCFNSQQQTRCEGQSILKLWNGIILFIFMCVKIPKYMFCWGFVSEYQLWVLLRWCHCDVIYKHLLVYVILFKCIHFKQYFVCLHNRIFNCCNVLLSSWS